EGVDVVRPGRGERDRKREDRQRNDTEPGEGVSHLLMIRAARPMGKQTAGEDPSGHARAAGKGAQPARERASPLRGARPRCLGYATTTERDARERRRSQSMTA